MPADRSRRLWILCAVAGIAVIVFVAWFARAIPAETCTGAPPPGVSSLVLFQLANTSADLEAVFGPAADPCRAAMIAAMDRANRVDLLGFIETYTLFLALFFLALRREIGGRFVRLGLAAVAATLAFDTIETATQLLITGDLSGSRLSLLLLAVGSRGKFLGLAAVCAAAGAAVLARGGRLGRVVGVLCIAGGALVLLGLLVPAARAGLGIGNGVAWLLMLVYAIVAAFDGRGTVAAN